jgi:hypothetical protein
MAEGGEKRGSIWYWIAGGCGVVILLGAILSCVGPMLVAMWFQDFAGGMGGMGATPVATGPVASAPHGLELPAAPAPIGPWTASVPAQAKRRVVVQVTSATGAAIDQGLLAVSNGDELFVDVTKISDGEPCRARLAIGADVIYGESDGGYVECTVYDGIPILANDYLDSVDDGDPGLAVDQNLGTFRVWDSTERGGFDVSGTVIRVEEIQ